MKKNNNSILFSIVFIGILISASILFFAWYGGRSDDFKLLESLNSVNNSDDKISNSDEFVDLSNGEVLKSLYSDMEDLDKNQPFMGEKDAPVLIVEFANYRCFYCSNFAKYTLPDIKEKYIDNGQVRFVYRDFMLNFNGDYEDSMAAECIREQAGDDVFFDIHEEIFQKDSFSMDFYYSKIEEFDLDKKEFDVCFKDERFKEEIWADTLYGSETFDINATPVFLINNTLVSGSHAFDVFEEIIDEELGE